MQTVKPPTLINLCVVRGACPGKCVHCPIGKTPSALRAKKFGYGFVGKQNFKKLCNEILEFNHDTPPTLRIHGVGEPALWPDLGKMLRFAKEKNIKTWVFTMGMGTTKNYFIENFKHADIVEFSINASDPKDFMETKGVAEPAFEEISMRMNELAMLKDKPRVIVSRVETKDEIKDNKFIEYWNSFNLFDDVFIRSFHDYGERITDKDKLLDKNKPANNSIKSCLVPLARMNIDGVLGVTVRCFNELFDPPEIVMERATNKILYNKSLKEIWESQAMEEWRKNIFGYHACAVCKSCQPPNPHSSEKQLI